MTWWESFRTARRALSANMMRSFLTMLGIIVGVASVITMVAVGSGAQTQIAEQIRTLGANVLMIQPGAASEGGARTAAGARVRVARTRFDHRSPGVVGSLRGLTTAGISCRLVGRA